MLCNNYWITDKANTDIQLRSHYGHNKLQVKYLCFQSRVLLSHRFIHIDVLTVVLILSTHHLNLNTLFIRSTDNSIASYFIHGFSICNHGMFDIRCSI